MCASRRSGAALNDDSEAARFIQTVPRRGYRFVAPVEAVTDVTETAPATQFAEGETVALELAGACRHYTAGLARTMQLGAKPQKVAEVEKAVLEGMDCGARYGRPREVRRMTSRPPGARRSRATASRRNPASAIRSASPIRRIGASTRSACGKATGRSWSPAMCFMRSSACGWRAGASRSARRFSSPQPGARRSRICRARSS